MSDLVYRKTKSDKGLDRFFMENGLEYSEEHPVATDRVACWEAVDENNQRVAAIALALRQEKYIIDGIAVDEEYRKGSIGEKLLVLAVDETRRLGGKEIFLVARAPGFFAKQGFSEVPREEAPNFFECMTCPQRGVDCHPQVMRFEVK